MLPYCTRHSNISKEYSECELCERMHGVHLTRTASLPCVDMKCQLAPIRSTIQPCECKPPTPPPILQTPPAPITCPCYTPQFGPVPIPMTCPCCQCHCMSKVKRYPNIRTHLMSLLLCVFCLLPCVFLPYCLNSCRNTNHFCPNCKTYIGTHYN